MIELRIESAEGIAIAKSVGGSEAFLYARHAFADGDRLVVTVAKTPCHIEVTLDAGMPPARLYLREGPLVFSVPFGARRKAYPPQAFSGDLQRISCRILRAEEMALRRNLALNPYDDHGAERAFPHAFANVETRGEAVFAARNAIDGEKANSNHGFWPFTSWGINRDPEATLTIDFGRPVLIEEVVFYLRADFPHDAWWRHASLDCLPDAGGLTFDLVKTGDGQAFSFAPRRVERLRLHSLIKADDPSPFPALTQIEVWGRDV
ncbi:MAG TPA: carbohydrate-binding protein [Ensifer sp.]|nr:carbohydrate-binding protein [Ensifer sp.]